MYNIHIIYKYCIFLCIFQIGLKSQVTSHILMRFYWFLISCKIRAKIGGPKSRILALLFAGVMNYSYLCIVKRKRWNLIAGHQKFAFRPGKICCLPRAQKKKSRMEMRKIKKN